MIKRKPIDDNMDWICDRFMKILRHDFRGHKAEITTTKLVKYTEKFGLMYGLKEGVILDALMRRKWLEPIGSNTYHIDYSVMERE